MNHLILNRDFRLPDDGWYQIAPMGDFPHPVSGIMQVIDAEACDAMVARFAADASTTNFPGLLIDFDHFSLDGEKRSEAAGWILGLEKRDDGLWAQIRWSDSGEEAVKGGRYRFLSPVWARSDCVDLGISTSSGQAVPRVRPIRILNAAVTNDPNLKGMVPLSNRAEGETVDFYSLNRQANGQKDENMKTVIEKLVNYLGLAADATEAVILEKMQGLLALTAVAELENSLKQVKDECEVLRTELKGAEDEIVNRHLVEFEGVVTEKTKTFWTEQLMANRAGALAALHDLMSTRHVSDGKPSQRDESPTVTRKPLHNRTTARPVIPGAGCPSTGLPEGQAVKIRNRAHEIAKAEGLPFGVAFRRAEREVVGSEQ